MTFNLMSVLCLFVLLPAAVAEIVFEKQVDAAPSAKTRYSVAKIGKDKGALAFRLKADFLSVNDNQARHVFHLWADPFNRVDATYDPLQSQLEVLWVGDGRRTQLNARDLYWQAKAVHQVALTWQPSTNQNSNGSAGIQLVLHVDGQKVDANENASPMKSAPATLVLGRADIGKSFNGHIESVRLYDAPAVGTPPSEAVAIREGPVWKETPEELAMLERFNATHKVAYLVQVRGGAEREARIDNKHEPTFVDVYGIKMTSITKKMIKNGWLEANKPTILYGPGGGAEGRDPEVEALIREYVQKGAGYYGICAGSNYAMDVGLLDSKERIKFSGKQLTALRYDPAHPIFHNVESFFRGEPHTAYYLHYAGPTWRTNAYPDAKAIMTFDQDTGVAMWEKRFGKGRVVVSSPHPEMSDQASAKNALQQRRIFRNSLYYVTGMLPEAEKKPTGTK